MDHSNVACWLQAFFERDVDRSNFASAATIIPGNAMDVVPDLHDGHIVEAAACGHFNSLGRASERTHQQPLFETWSLESLLFMGHAGSPLTSTWHICSLSDSTKRHSGRANRHEGNDTVTCPSAVCGIGVRPIFQVDTLMHLRTAALILFPSASYESSGICLMGGAARLSSAF